jgi:hypothetical protein
VAFTEQSTQFVVGIGGHDGLDDEPGLFIDLTGAILGDVLPVALKRDVPGGGQIANDRGRIGTRDRGCVAQRTWNAGFE